MSIPGQERRPWLRGCRLPLWSMSPDNRGSLSPCPAGTPSFLQDGCPNPSHTRACRSDHTALPLGCLCVWNQTSRPCGPSGLCPAAAQQSRGSSGSSIILMQDDAWQARHLGRVCGGSSGSCSLPLAGFLSPPGTTEHSGGSPWDLRQAPAPSRPQFPSLRQEGWNPCNRHQLCAWGAGGGGHGWNSFLVRGLRVPKVCALPCGTHLLGFRASCPAVATGRPQQGQQGFLFPPGACG